MKKRPAHKKISRLKHSPRYYAAAVLLTLVAALPAAAIARSYSNGKTAAGAVLGDENLSGKSESKTATETKASTEVKKEGEHAEEPEESEAPEPVENPEPKEPEEQEAENIHQEVDRKVERGQVEHIEVAPREENQETGTLKVQQTDGKMTEQQIPASQSPVATLRNVRFGNVSLRVNANGTVGLVNAGIHIETNYPIILDPQTQTVAIRTETGVIVLDMFPSQILSQLSPADKPTVTRSVQLTNENNQPAYTMSGTQTRRFIGIFPVEAAVSVQVSAKDGSVLSVDEPWAFKNLGFLYPI